MFFVENAYLARCQAFAYDGGLTLQSSGSIVDPIAKNIRSYFEILTFNSCEIVVIVLFFRKYVAVDNGELGK